MISFKLAKKLKEAGFPQEPTPNSEQTFVFDEGGDGGSYYLVCPKPEGCCYVDFWPVQRYGKWLQTFSDPISPANIPYEIVRLPSLSELINECSNTPNFVELKAPKITCEGDEFGVTCGWTASGLPYPIHPDGSVEEHLRTTIGTSPEEAVAKLWLDYKENPEKPI